MASYTAICQARRRWRSSDTMSSVGRFLNHFHRLSPQSYQVGGDEGYGYQLMDRMQEEGSVVNRFLPNSILRSVRRRFCPPFFRQSSLALFAILPRMVKAPAKYRASAVVRNRDRFGNNPRRAAFLTRSLDRYGHQAGLRTASTTSRIESITS